MVVSSKIYDKRVDFDFEIVNFPSLDGNVPCRPSLIWSVYFPTNQICESVYLRRRL